MAKMTRKEAVELLKNRKVYVRNSKESEAVQKKLFEVGFKWADDEISVEFTDKPYLFIWDDMEIAYSSSKCHFDLNVKTEISAEEIKAIEIVDEPKTSQQELNLCEILKDCPKGTKFYSTIFGDVEFERMYEGKNYPIVVKRKDKSFALFASNGYVIKEYDGECTLFPSKDQRDWSKWVCPKSDLPIDTPVMVSDDLDSFWLRYYAGNKKCWDWGFKKEDNKGIVSWKHIIPFDKFNPNNIEKSLKYDICKE